MAYKQEGSRRISFEADDLHFRMLTGKIYLALKIWWRKVNKAINEGQIQNNNCKRHLGTSLPAYRNFMSKYFIIALQWYIKIISELDVVTNDQICTVTRAITVPSLELF